MKIIPNKSELEPFEVNNKHKLAKFRRIMLTN